MSVCVCVLKQSVHKSKSIRSLLTLHSNTHTYIQINFSQQIYGKPNLKQPNSIASQWNTET